MSVPRPAMLVEMVTAPVAARLRDDFRFALVVLGVEHVMLDAGLLELVGDALGFLDRDRADQHRLPALVAVADFLDHGVELFVLGLVNDVVIVDADHRLVGRNHDHVEIVDFLELDRLGVGRAGHARRASCTCGSSSER